MQSRRGTRTWESFPVALELERATWQGVWVASRSYSSLWPTASKELGLSPKAT